MAKDGIDAFIIPTDDPHMSEYTAPFFERRRYISGFSGSAGTAVVTASKAYLWTDGRYFTQAEQELDNNWELMRYGMKDVPSPAEFLSKHLIKDSVIGVDPFVHAAGALTKLQEIIQPQHIKLKQIQMNPIDRIWEEDETDIRAAKPQGSLRVHPIDYAGQTVVEKLVEVRKLMNDSNVKGLVLTALDEIAWMTNIRGRDIPCNPVAIAYALITTENAILFIDSKKLSPEVSNHLSTSTITLKPYEDTLPTVQELASTLMTDNENERDLKEYIWMDDRTVNQALYSVVPVNNRYIKPSPIPILKAIKNEKEQIGMINAHKRDGVAFALFMSQLETDIAEGKSVTEVEVDERITECRRSQEGFIDVSFPTIAGVESNGAIIHYRAQSETCKTLGPDNIMLLDSGAQYIDGTTDVTRTIHTGVPTAYQKEMFTRVLKGHIALDLCVFPPGTAGCHLDVLARQYLWETGQDFRHGTGHGVGAALNVHEGPQGVSRNLNPQVLLPGMIISNEPGFYSKEFGIRIENLLLIEEKEDIPKFADNSFLGFKKLTVMPMQKKMMNLEMMTEKEKKWVNEYHEQVWNDVSPLLTDENAKKWLRENTTPL
eukprot:CAMPEP_0182429316 /NCGR_PEP_ID=MMETSP1167-20130531/25680_1 /TAXON_ID=2988 /ORGANISM="Mallomonas Sp, Strain CCMP3275" /LENGTH=599 /DNA_ID=CAMNT_0024612759 /DNA_START=217 /DNA_END=2016 /DNA_ORIENTATION=-